MQLLAQMKFTQWVLRMWGTKFSVLTGVCFGILLKWAWESAFGQKCIAPARGASAESDTEQDGTMVKEHAAKNALLTDEKNVAVENPPAEAITEDAESDISTTQQLLHTPADAPLMNPNDHPLMTSQICVEGICQSCNAPNQIFQFMAPGFQPPTALPPALAPPALPTAPGEKRETLVEAVAECEGGEGGEMLFDAHVHLLDFYQHSEGIAALLQAMDSAGVSHAAVM
eukprot:SAG11_NODE_58_length_19205_cov_30.697315_13_plen_228_part_00